MKMFILKIAFAFVILTSLLRADTVSWIEKAGDYLSIENKTYRWNSSGLETANQLKLNDLLAELPRPDEWSELRTTYAEIVPIEGIPESETLLMQLLLAYLDGDYGAAEQHLASIDSEQEVSGDSYKPSTDQLKRSLLSNGQVVSPQKVIEQFETELETYQPLTEESFIELLGDRSILEKVNLYLDAQQALMNDYMKRFEDSDGKGGGEIFQEFSIKSEKLAIEYAEAVQALEAHANDLRLQKYLRNRYYVMEDRYLPSIQVPDLVTLVGEERAIELLKKTFLTRVQLYINNADATLRLAQDIAFEHMDTLVVPQWRLLHSIDQCELYEAMDKKFPLEGSIKDDQGRLEANGYYLWGLVAAKRASEAIAMLQSSPELGASVGYDAVRKLKKAGYSRAVWSFLNQLLVAHPEMALWDEYIELSAELKENERMMEVVKMAIEADGLDAHLVIKNRLLLASACLSSNEIEAGVNWLKQALIMEAKGPAVVKAKFRAAKELVEVGLLLDESEWVQIGLDSVDISVFPLVDEYDNFSVYDALSVIRLYMKVGDEIEALRLVDQIFERAENLGKALVEKNKGKNAKLSDDESYLKNEITTLKGFRLKNRSSYQDLLVAKLGLLVSKENYKSAFDLLNDDSRWLVADIADILTESDESLKQNQLGWLVAKTLQENDKLEAAAFVLEALLRESNGYDSAYALYSEIKGADAINYFDKLFAIDQFEERPLIWKAQLLLDKGEIEAAEKIALKAISIDPSDGEQPKDDRMRVYDVMRQIRTAQGNTKDADFFENVVKAIRLSENADDYYHAGLYTEAIERYIQSLEFFQDAYCIQSRLAVRLYDEGRVDEAIKHYKKAYELMPSSFGQVESHCFGCESVFSGEEPQSIAEEVFSELLVTLPESPQVHYLMGYLRDYQEHEVEALKHFRNAVKLDPDYLNAWKKISSLASQMAMSDNEKDELILKIYSLDPLGKHSSPNLSNVKNVKVMWRTVLLQQELLKLVPKPKAVYLLAAAAKEVGVNEQDSFNVYFENKIEHPFDGLNRNPVIEAIENLFIQFSQIRSL